MLTEELNNGEAVIEWKIKNFHMSPSLNGEYIWSRTVSLSSLSNTLWYLELYPRGKQKDSAEYISCYLYRCDGDPEVVEIDFLLSVNSNIVEWKNECFRKGDKKGKSSFISRESISGHDDVLNILCSMSMSENSSVAAANKHKSSSAKLNKKALSFDKILSFITQSSKPSCSKNDSRVTNQTKPIIQYFIDSSISTETRSFCCSIKDFNLDTKRRADLPGMDDCELVATLSLKKSIDDTYLETVICFKDELDENIAAVCLIHILDSEGKICHSAKDEHLFVAENERDDWSFNHPFKWSDVKNCHYLYFQFSMSNGDISTNMESFASADCPKFPALDEDILKGFFRFYRQKKFCDVTLLTEEKAFECHKIVLCSMSSIFATMFESDTNTIEINDLDPDTVSQMLLFIYTGAVPDLEYERAIKLISAADKFQLEFLKIICNDFLSSTLKLNHENVCEILSFSDAQKDRNLKQSAVDYISTYKTEVLNSSQWKELAAKNVQLTYDVLYEISCKKN